MTEDQGLEAGGIFIGRAAFDAGPERYYAMARALGATRITVCEGSSKICIVDVPLLAAPEAETELRDDGDGCPRCGWVYVCRCAPAEDADDALRDELAELKRQYAMQRLDRDDRANELCRFRVDAHAEVTALRACVVAADALAAWVADGCDDEAQELEDVYAAARAKVKP